MNSFNHVMHPTFAAISGTLTRIFAPQPGWFAFSFLRLFALRDVFRPARLRMAFMAVATLVLALPTSAAVDPIRLYMAPDGVDNNTGVSRSKALGSLEGARDRIRELQADLSLRRPVIVEIADGRFPMTQPVTFIDRDSGTPDAPVRFEAAPGAHPVFDGGRRIEGWKQEAHGLWSTVIPEVTAGTWYFEQLWVNGRRAARAHWPSKGFLKAEAVSETVLTPGRRRAYKAKQTVTLSDGDFSAMPSIAPSEYSDVCLVVYHQWEVTRRFLSEIDPKGHALLTRGFGLEPWNRWDKNSAFVLENVRGALGRPGEWYLARSGTLVYAPLPGEFMDRAEVIAPVAPSLLNFGFAMHVSEIAYLTFFGLSFQHTQWLTPPETANNSVPLNIGTVDGNGARNIILENCEVAHTGEDGIIFRAGCDRNVIRHCFLHDIGSSGIVLGDVCPSPGSSGHNVIDNNIIRGGGAVRATGAGISIALSPQNEVTHNEISDYVARGVSIGVPTQLTAECHGNRILFNHVRRIGTGGLLCDVSGIYLWGPCKGSLISNNVVHDIDSRGLGGWGLYADRDMSGVTMENNLVLATKSGGLQVYSGSDNIIRNNIFAFGAAHQVQATRVEPHLSFTFVRNIVLGKSGRFFGANWDKVRTDTRLNCYWNADGRPIRVGERSFEQWQNEGHEEGSIVADPAFQNAAGRDFRLKPTSLALALGFQPFDFTLAGAYGQPAWVVLGRATTAP